MNNQFYNVKTDEKGEWTVATKELLTSGWGAPPPMTPPPRTRAFPGFTLYTDEFVSECEQEQLDDGRWVRWKMGADGEPLWVSVDGEFVLITVCEAVVYMVDKRVWEFAYACPFASTQIHTDAVSQAAMDKYAVGSIQGVRMGACRYFVRKFPKAEIWIVTTDEVRYPAAFRMTSPKFGRLHAVRSPTAGRSNARAI